MKFGDLLKRISLIIYIIHKDKSNMRLYYSLNWKMLNIKGRIKIIIFLHSSTKERIKIIIFTPRNFVLISHVVYNLQLDYSTWLNPYISSNNSKMFDNYSSNYKRNIRIRRNGKISLFNLKYTRVSISSS